MTEVYKQASESCRNYSDLTMKVRTLTQQVLITFVLGVGLFLTKVENAHHIPLVLTIAGGALILFSTALLSLNLHYSAAFNRIRDRCLIDIEKKAGVMGPWSAHATGQPRLTRMLAWYWPYVSLALVGVAFVIAATRDWTVGGP